MAYSPDQLTAVTQHVLQDPAVQQILQEWQTFRGAGGMQRGTQPGSYEHRLYAAMTAAGLPPDSRVDFSGPNGQPVVTNRGLPNWAYPLLFGAAVGTAGLASGAFAAPAAAASAGGSALPTSAAASLLGPGEGLGSLGQIGVPAMLSNAGVPAAVSQVPAAVTAASTLPKWVAPAATAGMAVAQRLRGSDQVNPSDLSVLPPDMQAILHEFARRVTGQAPLADATTAQALAGLPRTK